MQPDSPPEESHPPDDPLSEVESETQPEIEHEYDTHEHEPEHEHEHEHEHEPEHEHEHETESETEHEHVGQAYNERGELVGGHQVESSHIFKFFIIELGFKF